MAEGGTRTYRFEPLDTTGIFLGLDVLQCTLVGGGLLAAAVALTVGVSVPLAALPAAVGATLSFGRWRGRRGSEWLTLGAAWGWRRSRWGRRHLPRLPLVTDGESRAVTPPPWLAGLEITELGARGAWLAPLGAVCDRQAATLTALVPVGAANFALAPRGEQERLCDGWGEVVASVAPEGGLVTHLTWSDFAAPSGLASHRRWLASASGADADTDPAASYRELVAGAATVATTHEVVVSITVARARLPPRRRRGSDAEEALAEGLRLAVEALERGLRTAGLEPGPPLGAAELRRLLRRRLDPGRCRPAVVAGHLAERLGEVGEAAVGPVAAEVSWSALRVDGAWHRTYWVASWPRRPVGPAWLEPFLSTAGVTRAVTVLFRPEAPHAARRRIERELVKLESDAAAREEKGRRVDARHRRATEAVLEREAELVRGHAALSYVGLVTVSVASEAALAADGEFVEQLARTHGLELHALDGRHDVAWAAALPFGLAPRQLVSG